MNGGRAGLALGVIVCIGACGSPDELALSVSGGTYSDGSGSIGLAALVTLRDAKGRGPAGSWDGVIDRGGNILARFTYVDDAPGSLAVLVWPELPASPGSAYHLRLSDGARTFAVDFTVPGGAPLDVARISASPDGQKLQWSALPRAASYVCDVSSSAGLQLHAGGAGTSCDVSALPTGSYAARVRALSSDVEAIRASPAQRPTLPSELDVSESRFAFVRDSSGGIALTAAAVGGTLSYGALSPGLALWVSLAAPDGTAPAEDFTVEVAGPGIPAGAPLRFGYPAGTPQFLVWSYDVPPRVGQYSVVATSATSSLATTVTFGNGSFPLDIVTGLTASAQGSGGADISWTAVSRAASYYVGVWDHATGAFASGRWVAGTATAFANGTFAPGIDYDVYVAASDVDMIGTPRMPDTVNVAENTYWPASFTAR